MPLLDELLDLVSRNAKHHYKDKPDEQLMQIWHGRAQDGRSVVVGTPYRSVEEKEMSFRAVRDIFAAQQVVAYASVSEAWSRNIMTGKSREVVVIVAADTVTAKMRQFRIVRGANGEVKELVSDGTDKTEFAVNAGEVAGMLVTR